MRIIVVGAGVSGIHAGLTLSERGYAVELWDVGKEDARIPEARTDFHGRKDRLPDPTTHLYGARAGAVVPGLFAISMTERKPPTKLLSAPGSTVTQRIVSGALIERHSSHPPFRFAWLIWGFCLGGRRLRQRAFARVN
jgi:2-polyprenyl-6-methoxyphenol hydroxylase-like FAD-dependent oxidoreductase